MHLLCFNFYCRFNAKTFIKECVFTKKKSKCCLFIKLSVLFCIRNSTHRLACGCLNPNRLTLVAFASFFGGARRGVVLPEGTALLVNGSVSDVLPPPPPPPPLLPFLSMISVAPAARRRPTFAFPAADVFPVNRVEGAVLGRFLKPKDMATPLVYGGPIFFFVLGFSSSSGL